jgi:hypothetical protein
LRSFGRRRESGRVKESLRVVFASLRLRPGQKGATPIPAHAGRGPDRGRVSGSDRVRRESRGKRGIPYHPLTNQAISDCLNEAKMDIQGLERLLGRLESGAVRVIACDLTQPSPLAFEALSARPRSIAVDPSGKLLICDREPPHSTGRFLHRPDRYLGPERMRPSATVRNNARGKREAPITRLGVGVRGRRIGASAPARDALRRPAPS